jgi:cohesin complex subunit SA-1/2
MQQEKEPSATVISDLVSGGEKVSTFLSIHNVEPWSDVCDNLFTIIRGVKYPIFSLPIEAVKHCISACNHGFEWKLNQMSTADAVFEEVSGIRKKLQTYFLILKEVVTSDEVNYREDVIELSVSIRSLS